MPPEPPDQARWFATEVQPHRAALRAYLVAQFPTLADVDDIVQESQLRVLRAQAAGKVDSPKGLLFITARNLALDVLRRRKVVPFEPMTENTGLFVYNGEKDIPETVSQSEEFDLLSEAVQSLPDRCRQVFTLRMAFGLSQRETAAKLGISENTVERQMGKAIRRCTEFFARRGLP